MGQKTITDLEQLAELLGSVSIPCEGESGNTSLITLAQLFTFLHASITELSLSGSAPTYSVNPAVNSVNKLDLSTLLATDTCNINLPAGLVTKEAQIVIKVKNPNLATVAIPGLNYRLSMLALDTEQFQIIMDYDQALGQWVGGTLGIEEI